MEYKSVSSIVWFKIVQLSRSATDDIGAFEVAFLSSRKIKPTLAVERKTSFEDRFSVSIDSDTWRKRKGRPRREMAQRRSLKRRKFSREEGEEVVREERMEMMPTAMPSTFVPMPCCFSAPSTAPMGATASYILIMETQNRIKLKTD